jgi:hypothetical protein
MIKLTDNHFDYMIDIEWIISITYAGPRTGGTGTDRIRLDLAAASAARHPASVVGPSAAAVLGAVVAAAASPPELAELAAVTPGSGVGVTGTTVELLASSLQGRIPPLFRPIPGSLSVATGVLWHGLALAVGAFAAASAAAAAASAAGSCLSGDSRPGCVRVNGLQQVKRHLRVGVAGGMDVVYNITVNVFMSGIWKW